jgi:transposase
VKTDFWGKYHKMAKDREQKIARILYVEQGKTAKEISQLKGVSEQTISKWVGKFGWRDQRNARISSPSLRVENIRQLINELSEQRLEYGRELKEAEAKGDAKELSSLRKQIAQVDDAVSKWNKTLENVGKESRISLTTYLACMEMIFDSLRAYDEKKFFETIEFQEAHLNEVSLKFK